MKATTCISVADPGTTRVPYAFIVTVRVDGQPNDYFKFKTRGAACSFENWIDRANRGHLPLQDVLDAYKENRN